MLKEVEFQLVNKLSASWPVEKDGSIQVKRCMAGTKRSHTSAGYGGHCQLNVSRVMM